MTKVEFMTIYSPWPDPSIADIPEPSHKGLSKQ